MSIKKRAISEEQKLERKKDILNTALNLFEISSFHEISIAKIAKKTGIAKGTVFIYFKTKEELFLSITKTEIEKLLPEQNHKKQFSVLGIFNEIIKDKSYYENSGRGILYSVSHSLVQSALAAQKSQKNIISESELN